MKIKNILLVFSLCMAFYACNDFLDEAPSKEGVIPEKVSDLQKKYQGGFFRSGYTYPLLITDDATLPFTSEDIEKSNGYAKYVAKFLPLAFQRDYMSKLVSHGSKGCWEGCYSGIYNDNYVLSMVNSDKLEGTKKEREIVASFAHFHRAFLMFKLVTTYCQPWAPGKNDNDLGIVLKDEYTLEFDKNTLGRKTLKESYEFIEKDLLASFNIPEGDERWCFTKTAVNAFAARFYLMIGDYNEALKYACTALEKTGELEDYTTFSVRWERVGKTYIEIIPEFYDKTITNDCSILNVKDEYFIDLIQTFANLFIPSQELLDLYQSDDDVRKALFPVNGLATTNFFGKKSGNSSSKTSKWPIYKPYSYGSFMTIFPNAPEMLLIKAECLVRETNDLIGAKTALNNLRSKRIKNYDEASVNEIATAEEMLSFIFDERRRERPFILRALDIRRLHAIENQTFEIKRNFFEMTESKISVPAVEKEYLFTENDYANKLFEGDLTLSNGYLEQNP